MESSKVKLPKAVAEDIKWIRSSLNCSNRDILNALNSGEHLALIEYGESNLDDLLSAIVNGYEVEQTPEDKVREYYRDLTVKATEKDTWDKFGVNLHRSEMQGIINTLRFLNIKIEGVNDHENN